MSKAATTPAIVEAEMSRLYKLGLLHEREVRAALVAVWEAGLKEGEWRVRNDEEAFL